MERENGETEDVATIDLSASGALLDVARSGNVGEVVFLRFQFSAGVTTEAAGVIRRCKPAFGGKRHALAVAFTEPQSSLFSAACARELALSGWKSA